MLGEAGPLLGGRHAQDAVEVEVHAAEHLVAGGDGRQPLDQEAADQDVVERVGLVALVDAHLPRLLVVDHRDVGVGPAGGQGRVAGDDRMIAVLGRAPVEEPEVRRPERVGRDVDEDAVHVVAGQAGGQHARPERHAEVGVHLLARDQARLLPQELEHQGRPRRATDQQDLVDLVGLLAGIRQRPVHAVERALDQVADQALVLLARHLEIEVHGHAVALGQVLLPEARVGLEAELLLGLLGRAQEAAHRPAVAADVGASGRDEAGEDKIEQELIEVVAAQAVIAVAGQDFGHVAGDLHERRRRTCRPPRS